MRYPSPIERTTRRRMGLGITLAVGLSAAAVCAQDEASGPSPERVAFGGKEWPAELVRQAYEKVWMRYVSLPPLSRIVPAKSVGATRVEGVVTGLASGRRVIIQHGNQVCAVMLRGTTMPVVGAKVRLMVVAAGAEQFSYERGADSRVSLPHYVDVTMSYEDFVRHLRRGGHFPEAPELGTKPGRMGLFQLGRGERNKVEGLIREREESEKASPSSSIPK